MPNPIKYTDYQICLQEIPDEISLGFSISGCPNKCKGCHSPHLWKDSEYPSKTLIFDHIRQILRNQDKITCILFLGGEWHSRELTALYRALIQNFPYKLAMYTGLSQIPNQDYLKYLTYFKIGRYIEKLGGLNKPTTNQRLYRMDNGKVVKDITHLFWRKHNDL